MHVIDAPLGLCNVLTMLCSIACLWIALHQVRRRSLQHWLLAAPGVLAAVVAVVLLGGVFNSDAMTDAEWVAALLVGAFLGRLRGWSLPAAAPVSRGAVLGPGGWDTVIIASIIAAASAVDFASAALQRPVLLPSHVATITAFCAGFLAARTIAVFVRLSRSTASQH